MHRSIFLAACALTVVACGGSDKPAQDPTTTSAVAPMDSTPTASSASAPSTDTSSSSTAGNAVDTPTSMANTSSNGQTATGGSQTTPPQPTQPTQPSAGAVVVGNPGVANQTSNADNTKVNDRDRHGALTPMDQGNSSSETQITASIRKAVVGDKTLSFTAKNVKIITTGTKVTLRGPVKTDQEKSTIETAARQTSGVTMVDDQIEVKK